MKPRPVSGRRIGMEAIAVVGLQLLLAHLLARAHLVEHLLAPGSDSYSALAVTTAFLALRIFVYVFAPGWLLARIWLRWARSS